METKMKTCSKCKISKSISEFYWNKTRNAYASQCKQCHNEYMMSQYPLNKDKMSLMNKEWRQNNPEKVKKYNNKYSVEQRRNWKREWDKKAMLDPLHRLSNNLRGNMYHALKAMKGFRKWETLVGYTLDELAKHLESQFTKGITWDNYGKEWHVDHIIPKSWFKYVSTDDPKFKECWALSNLQPKLKLENIRKGNRTMG
jgi:hypothetical protein